MYVRHPTISYTFWLSRWEEGKERKSRWSEEQPAGNLWLSKFVTCHYNLQGLTQDLAGKKAMIQQAYNFCLLAIIGLCLWEGSFARDWSSRRLSISETLIFITLVVTAFISVFLSLGARWCNHVPPKSEEGPGFFRHVTRHDPVVLLGYPHATVCCVTGAFEGGLDGIWTGFYHGCCVCCGNSIMWLSPRFMCIRHRSL